MVSLFSFVDMYARALVTVSRLLDKADEHALALKISVEEVLDLRLIDDMKPLRFQLMVVINFTQQWPARVAGIAAAESLDETASAEALRAATEVAIGSISGAFCRSR